MFRSSSTILLLTIFLVTNIILISCIPWKSEQHKGTESKHQHLLNQTHEYGQQIHGIFLGDSITEGWLNNGKNVWKQYYSNRHVFNYGIGGDRTEHVLWRIENGELDGLNPKLIVFEIGYWNIVMGDSSVDIAEAIRIILEKLLKKFPNTKILLISVLPWDHKEDHMQKIDEINSIIKNNSDDSKIFYLDLAKYFRNESGQLIDEYYNEKTMILSKKGYQIWHKIMKPMFEKLLQ
uniref:Platelet-activating factor acetylhydrolase IB subunit beta homolog n=1 Tax=Dermatophagoides pteronyssinus TaxID=6956 RepID=A0A6P6XNH4_DERPT|nr:platelet-activating factor acetylhydrolase IB subunit beta homolog [Dermatophagoides pteronyssinus]